MSDTDARLVRNTPEDLDEFQIAERNPHFRVDLERIRFSPHFSRLSAVTQVISQSGAGLAVHNRLIHSVKVSAVARAIAMHLRRDKHGTGALLEELGGCDPTVVQAAASAHDVGHPPFGHLGEKTLDRLARDRFRLREGFEGNAQTYRILTRLDEHAIQGVGLNLTRAVRAAVLKYPWRRGEGGTRRGAGSDKFSMYVVDAADAHDALSAFPMIAPGQQTVDCSVMDVADDIAYSMHDLDDFYRAGLLNQTTIAGEFHQWRRNAAELRSLDLAELGKHSRMPGHGLELLWRRLESRDPWIADADAFEMAVAKVTEEVVGGLLTVPFDGSLSADRALAGFTDAWIRRLQASVEVHRNPAHRSGHVSLNRTAWHEVAVLKFVHEHFILDRPDLAVYQRGQASLLERIVDGFTAWLDDPHDVRRAPRRLLDLVDLATEDYLLVSREDPGMLPDIDETELRRRARGRGIIDYVSALTDAQAVHLDALLAGDTERLWDAGQGL